ncbi:hypothetical protein CMsap09_11020 [Clavibacter michiganensis]|uniref:Serine protease n=1 Tax=Clavibacter michiganensis TaxID=28447 RepID=A0A251XVC0_9MICO|nr:hypothetical protein CMsap09_11020 [Clavibacter michiganensis]
MPRSARSARHALAAVMLAAAVALLGGAPGAWAHAPVAPVVPVVPVAPVVPVGDPVSPDAGRPRVVALAADEVAATAAFWTPARLGAADRATAEAMAQPATSLAAAPVRHAARVAPVPHVGRMYMVNADDTFQTCSANAVVSGNGLTVATAAHCIDDFGAFHAHIAFVPAYEDGRAPFGTWPLASYVLPAGWTGAHPPASDTAFFTVSSPTGRTLAVTVGASPVLFGERTTSRPPSTGIRDFRRSTTSTPCSAGARRRPPLRRPDRASPAP